MKLSFLTIFLFSIFLYGCFMGKPLKEKKNLYIELDFETIVNSSSDSKYANNLKWNEYKNAFIKGLENEGHYYNLETTFEKPASIDFTLVIKSFAVKESIHSETVSDEKSAYNGKTFELSSLDATSVFFLYKGDKKELLGEWSTYANKDEKITNNRNFGDFVFGSNKDNSQYRYKELKDDICIDLSEKCGKHVIAKITRKLSKNL